MSKIDPGKFEQNRKSSVRGINRRGFFQGAAALSGLGAAGLLVRGDDYGAFAAEAQVPAATPGATDALAAQTQKNLRWAGPPPADWVRARSGVDHNVVIVGGGQTGLSLAYGLKRKGVGKVQVIDQSAPGEAGIWRTIARMHQLRTPKMIIGPEQGNPSLGFRAWYETLHSPGAFDGLDRIPRLAWAEYLAWFEQATGTQVRYRTRLVDIEPVGDVLRLHLETDGMPRTETTRKLVLANGYSGAGGASVPGFLRALPAGAWTHTERPIDFASLRGKSVGVLGAGASAFDAAAVALESGASEVHLFSRRSYIEYTNVPGPQAPRPSADRGHANNVELSYGLPEEVRWRNQLGRERGVASVPMDSLNRTVTSDKFRLYLNSGWDNVAMAGTGKVAVKSRDKTFQFDHVIAGTGYRVDLSGQPELTRFHGSIVLWRDRYKPAASEEDAASAAYPYLGPGFQFLAREEKDAAYLRNIHCANLAASLSFGILMGDVPSMVLQPRLVTAIAQDLFVEGLDLAANKRSADFVPTPPDPAPYQKAVRS